MRRLPLDLHSSRDCTDLVDSRKTRGHDFRAYAGRASARVFLLGEPPAIINCMFLEILVGAIIEAIRDTLAEILGRRARMFLMKHKGRQRRRSRRSKTKNN